MSAWKVLLIVALASLLLALGMATVAIPIAHDGGERWAWLAGLLTATCVTGAALAAFMHQAGRSLDLSPRGARR